MPETEAPLESASVVLKQLGGETAIELRGSLDLTCSALVFEAALGALREGGEIRINAAAAEHLSGSAIQTLLALRREAAVRGVGFRVEPRPAARVEQAVRTVGAAELWIPVAAKRRAGDGNPVDANGEGTRE